MRILALTGMLLSLAFSNVGLAHEGLGKIVGEDIDIAYGEHTFAGVVGEHLLYASPLADEFGVKLTHRAGEKDFESVLKYENDMLSGTVQSLNRAGTEVVATIKFTNIEAATGKIEGELEGQVFSVQVSSDTMDGNHYVNPKFDVVYGDKSFQFQLNDGAACIGCSTKISFVVLTMLKITGKI